MAPEETQTSKPVVFHCTPLLVVHESDGLVYRKNTDVEFTPDSEGYRTGRARALTPSPDDWYPEVTVTDRHDLHTVAVTEITSTRGGACFFGTDDEGYNFTWYIDGYADNYLKSRASGEPEPEIEAFEDPEPPGGGKKQPEGHSYRSEAPAIATEETRPPKPTTLYCMPLLVVQETDGLVYSKETQIEFTPDSPDANSGRVKALTPSNDDWYPEMTVTDRFDLAPVSLGGMTTTRAGISFCGTDDEGYNFTWYIDGYADDYLLSAQSNPPPGGGPVSESEIG